MKERIVKGPLLRWGNLEERQIGGGSENSNSDLDMLILRSLRNKVITSGSQGIH